MSTPFDIQMIDAEGWLLLANAMTEAQHPQPDKPITPLMRRIWSASPQLFAREAIPRLVAEIESLEARLAEACGDERAKAASKVTVEDIERMLGRIPSISCWCRGDCLDPRRCWAEHLAAGGEPPQEYLDALRDPGESA